MCVLEDDERSMTRTGRNNLNGDFMKKQPKSFYCAKKRKV